MRGVSNTCNHFTMYVLKTFAAHLARSVVYVNSIHRKQRKHIRTISTFKNSGEKDCSSGLVRPFSFLPTRVPGVPNSVCSHTPAWPGPLGRSGQPRWSGGHEVLCGHCPLPKATVRSVASEGTLHLVPRLKQFYLFCLFQP